MTPDPSEEVRRGAPLVIKAVEFHDLVLVVSGEDWGLTATCPWRVLKGGFNGDVLEHPHRGRLCLGPRW
jgi:hypothetical protein